MLTVIPTRVCQALNDSSEGHPAEVVCNRDGLEWFSCLEHVPDGVPAVPLRDWYVMHKLMPSIDPTEEEEHALRSFTVPAGSDADDYAMTLARYLQSLGIEAKPLALRAGEVLTVAVKLPSGALVFVLERK